MTVMYVMKLPYVTPCAPTKTSLRSSEGVWKSDPVAALLESFVIYSRDLQKQVQGL